MSLYFISVSSPKVVQFMDVRWRSVSNYARDLNWIGLKKIDLGVCCFIYIFYVFPIFRLQLIQLFVSSWELGFLRLKLIIEQPLRLFFYFQLGWLYSSLHISCHDVPRVSSCDCECIHEGVTYPFPTFTCECKISCPVNIHCFES
jgi:hypothetical protein